mmetsp:Transcript_6742/g.15402  ORF Transcript_6742/g.15402 Transcript_6742/m.15402 type:complete len:83 (-) Transcript_6742:797-1045(-)
MHYRFSRVAVSPDDRKTSCGGGVRDNLRTMINIYIKWKKAMGGTSTVHTVLISIHSRSIHFLPQTTHSVPTAGALLPSRRDT